MTTMAQRSVARDMRREQREQKAALTLDVVLASKLVSIVVHADEITGPVRHIFDLSALQSLLADKEVRAWVKTLRVLAPVRRER